MAADPAPPQSEFESCSELPPYLSDELFAAELAAVILQAVRYTQLINVYQSMGRGWVDIAMSMAPAPSVPSCANARLHLIFKLRLYEPTDKTSRDFVDSIVPQGQFHRFS